MGRNEWIQCPRTQTPRKQTRHEKNLHLLNMNNFYTGLFKKEIWLHFTQYTSAFMNIFFPALVCTLSLTIHNWH